MRLLLITNAKEEVPHHNQSGLDPDGENSGIYSGSDCDSLWGLLLHVGPHVPRSAGLALGFKGVFIQIVAASARREISREKDYGEMATVPGQLIWEIVKRNNSFLVKEFGNGNAKVQFSKEPNNLYNLNTFKYSGLANKKTVTIQPGHGDQSVLLATTKTKKQNKPSSLLNKSIMKKEFHRMAKAVENQVAENYYRRDLKKAALAKVSAVNRTLKVAKSGVKKRNRQAVKVRASK